MGFNSKAMSHKGFLLFALAGCVIYTATHLFDVKQRIKHVKSMLFHIEKPTKCQGHFQITSIRSLFQENKLYGSASFPVGDIFNFSKIARFPTAYFKTGTKSSQRNIRWINKNTVPHYMLNEFKEKWFTRNVVNNVSRSVVSLLCSLNPFNYFKYTVQFLGIKSGSPSKALFIIDEKNLSTHPNYVVVPNIYGPVLWSNIYADITTPRTQASCSTTDYIKGRYFIECPLLEYKFNIAITGSYLAPSIYDYKCKQNDAWLIKSYTYTDLETSALGSISKAFENLTLPKCTTNDFSNTPGFWIKLEGVWHFATRKCFYPFTFDQKKKECLKKKTFITFGDSHTRRRTAAMKKYLLVDATYINGYLASHVNSLLVANTKIIKNSRNPVVILNAGHWSFVYTDAASYMSDMMETFEIISSLRVKIPTAKFIWMETTSIPHNEFHGRRRVNNFIVALNEWVNYHMNRIGVEVVPAFDISHHMRDHSMDGCHYFDFLEQDAVLYKDKISVAGAIISVLINTICP